jgi:RNA methyltransferase, TrmH family
MNITPITSHANPQIKKIKSLELRKYRKETGLFLAEGLRSVIEGVELNAPLEQLVVHHDHVARPEVQRLINATRTSVLSVTDDILSKLSHKDNPQTVLGVFRQNFAPLATLQNGVWVGVEQIRDPGNLGTIIRTIDAAGAAGIVLIGSCCDPYAPESVRASMGSIFAVPIVSVTEDAFYNWRKDYKHPIIGTALQTNTDYREISYPTDMMVMMGNEQAGLSEIMRTHCTHLVKMPMRGRADSLNLAVATAVMLYSILK